MAIAQSGQPANASSKQANAEGTGRGQEGADIEPKGRLHRPHKVRTWARTCAFNRKGHRHDSCPTASPLSCVFDEQINGESFLAYVEQVLVPTHSSPVT